MSKGESPMKTFSKSRLHRSKTWMSITTGVFAALLVSIGVAIPGAMAFSTDSLVWEKCSSCHEPQRGKIPRVEEIRTTPEEWAVIVDRMARLWDMDLNRDEMDILLKELCSTQGLTAEEAEKVSYLDLLNNPQTIETPQPGDPDKLFVTCVRCHSAGKIYSFRMTESAWKKVRDYHLYMTPTVIGQMREMRWIPEADAVLEKLAESQPYGKAMKPSKVSLAGSWLILGYEPGKGDYRGYASLKDGSGGDYEVEGTLQYADGSQDSFQGDATLYGGTALRTRTRHNGFKTLGAYNFANGTLRGQHHFPAPDFRTSTSNWHPVNGKPQILKVSPGYLLSNEKTTLLLEGIKLPQVEATDIRVEGGSVEILSAKRISADAIEAQVVYRDSGFKQAKLNVKGLDAGTLTLASQIDHISVTPEMGRARNESGRNFPAEGVQFEAIAYSAGADAGNPADDVVLGPVPATFTLSESVDRPGDDDLQWLGAIEADGTYQPNNGYGPIRGRELSAEGIGHVKVNAEYQRGAQHYTAHAALVVTVPDFVPRLK
jgi:quinohemoprotein amine dehydrogenase